MGTTSSRHGSYVWGYTHATMAGNNGLPQRELERILKAGLSWNCRLQLACMNVELLVTVGQHTTVNTFSGLVHTARQVMEVGNTRSRWANPFGRQVPRVGLVTGTKS